VNKVQKPFIGIIAAVVSTRRAADAALFNEGKIMNIMTNEQIRQNFVDGKLTWADLLVITGLPQHILYEILSDYF
jgi:hypothetical protein